MKKLLLAGALALAATSAQAQHYGTGSNPNSHSVQGHVTTSGTYVQPYQTTNPNSTQRDNYSATGNVNPFESVVLQSANVLFSTANSGDLARLVADHAQFDWVIVEEAAKATGPELLAPLLLSMRRLLIGDHNQLPPFDTDRILEFLSDQSKVADAVSESNSLVGGIFHEFGLDELLEVVDDGEELSRTSMAAKRAVRLFESLVVPELEWGAANPGRKQVATELLKQHRMHPVIATVISECFYDKRLLNGQGVEERFATEKPPFDVLDASLASPIVVIDMPYMQRRAGAAEELPLYHNPAEIEAVVRVLSTLRPTADKDGNPPLRTAG
jgi:superfamily I DNA and/or RNA helicase